MTKARWRANPHGEQYDSRSGVAGYYRYGPRKVRELCEDTEHGVKVARVNVHPAVFERIERHQVEYAPVSLDRPFDVLGASWAAKGKSRITRPWRWHGTSSGGGVLRISRPSG